MSYIAYFTAWVIVALMVATSAVVLPLLLVGSSWLAGWWSIHHRPA